MDFKLVDTVRLQKFKDKLLNIINTNVTTINNSISSEATARDAAISKAIATEVSNRNSAISSAIATEVTNRNTELAKKSDTGHTHSNATTKVSGFMSATDKTKLDGIATGAGVQVNSDWNATSGFAQILNKPTLATVATSGKYTDLSGTPTIPTVPTQVSAFQNDSGYLTSHQSLADYAKTADIEGTPSLINETSTTFISSCQLKNGKLSAELKNLPTATITNSGIVQLSNATDSTAEDVAATSKAVKDVYDHLPALGTSAVSCGADSTYDYNSFGTNSAGTSTSAARADHQHILKIPLLSDNNSGIVTKPRDTDYFQVLTSGYYYNDGSFYLNPKWNTPNFNVEVSVLKANCFYDVGYTFTPNTTVYRPPTFSNSVNSISVEYDYFHNKLYIKANLSSSYNSSGGTTQITKCGILIKKLFNTTFQKILFQTSNPQTNEWQRIRYTVNGCESAMTNADGDAKFEFTNYYNNAEDVYIISDIYLTSSF